jgi:hypothetical protein
MRVASFAIAAVVLGAAAGSLEAQTLPISVEVRADAAFPTGSFGDAVDTGLGVGVSAALAVMPNLGVYGSYSRTEFALSNADGRAVDSGFAAGLTTTVPGVAFGGAQPWVGAGALFHKLDVGGTSQGDIGFEVGGGVAIPLGERLRLTPGVGYRQYGAGDANVSYVTAGVGMNVVF